MANKTFEIEVIAPDRTVYSSSNVVSVVLPSSEGFLGILADHAPLVAELKIGEVVIRDSRNDVQEMAVSGGFAEVMNNKVILLAESAELADEIDVDRAQKAKERALKLLEEHESVNFDRAQVSLQKAMLRLNIAKHKKHH